MVFFNKSGDIFKFNYTNNRSEQRVTQPGLKTQPKEVGTNT